MSIQWSCHTYDEDIARVVHGILSAHGSHELSLRAIARAARLSPGTLAYQFETKQLLLARCTRVTGRLLVDDLLGRAPSPDAWKSAPTMVARDQDELADLRVWLDLVALARANPVAAKAVRDTEDRFRAALTRWLSWDDGGPPDPADAHHVWLVLQAVWSDQLTPGKDLDVEEAQALVRRLLPNRVRSCTAAGSVPDPR